MGLQELFTAVREAAGGAVWGAAVELARDGAVEGLGDDGEEVHLRVKTRHRARPFEVWLWPEDLEWGCDCGQRGEACVHVAAGVIGLQRSRVELPDALPAAQRTYQIKLSYAFRTVDDTVELERRILWPDGRIEPLRTTLAESHLMASRGDAQAEGLLAMHRAGPLPADTLRRLLQFLEGAAQATLDGQPIRLSPEPVLFRVRVTDDKEGFRVGLYRPAGIDRLFRGAALVGDTLHPTSHGELTPDQRKMLVAGVKFSADEVGVLVGEYLPRLQERAPVDIDTNRLPKADALVPRVAVHLQERPGGLEIRAEIVYGDPPVARVTSGGTLERMSDAVVPARDIGAERVAQRIFEEKVGRSVGFRHLLPPSEAAAFLQGRLTKHEGPVHGKVDPKRFEVVGSILEPSVSVTEVEGQWQFAVSFGTDRGHEADPHTVLEAWRMGRSLVPLLDGGYAPLPDDWLKEHGALLRELMDARDREGRVDRNSTAALVELLEDTAAEVPPDLRRLKDWLEGGEGLPEVPLPTGLTAELRPYQVVGFRWLAFLREMDLHGILADDMGLGKTIQALAAILDTSRSNPGARHLVIAPTSVLRNWEREAQKFAPGLKVNVYHGAHRRLDDSDVTLTSYALLRIDLEALRSRQWSYLILDEAQAIKNATSQTARAAFQLRADHRLCLTGTPVENRLEELWSLFRFLMPGLLGSQESFRERFSRPIEAGDDRARKAMRSRVRPYLLRRLKQQVEKDLPLLTEMTVRCELGAEQRKVYDTVRLTSRREVIDAISRHGERGATMHILEALLRMRQACCDPALLPGEVGAGAGSAKLDRLEELLVEVVVDDHKALVFSQWTSFLDLVEPRLEKLGIDWVRLDGTTRDRQGAVDRFQSPNGPPVFLLSLKAGGFGLNLTAADYVLHLDPWWNPAVERQATDRAHRIGQDKPVVSCRLIAEDTVEERILELQDAKRSLADAALGTEGGFLRTLTADELRSLFEAA